MRIGSLFTGYGGLDMAVERFFGATTAWTSDIDPGACKIIAHRMPHAPNHGDITEIDWATVEPVDIVTGGFPCQDLSHAGKRLGLKPGTRSGLWSHMAYAISQLRPRYVIAENVRGLLSASADSSLEPCPWCVGGTGDGEPDLRALGAVLGDLAELGYDAQWVGLRAADVGAPHGRFRVFVVAHDSEGNRRGPSRDQDHQAGAVDALVGATDCVATDTERSGLDWGSAGVAGTPDAAAGSGRTVAHSERRGRDGWVGELGQGWREQPANGGDPAADAAVQRRRATGRDDGLRAEGLVPVGVLAADADSDGQQGIGWLEPVPRDTDRRSGAHVAWGDYEPAIRRWERVLGRPAPAPTETGPKGGQRLSPRFVEWMMGLPDGWVTDVPDLGRNAQLKALGNGVVPQQALEALRRTLPEAVAA